MEAVLVSLARLLGADWLALIRTAERIEVRAGGTVVRRGAPCAPREVDPGLLEDLEPGRAASFGPEVLRRWPRTAGSELREVVAYATAGRPALRLIVGSKEGIGLDLWRFEELARIALAVVEAEERTIPGAAMVEGACATHDLRHLLTAALLELERARIEAGASEALSRLRTTLEQARALCEPWRGEPEIHPLLPILDTAARDAATSSASRDRVAVRVHCAPDLAIRVDRNLLERALRNLVSNAIEATPDGGAVELEAASRADGEIVLSVRDEGRGIAREDLRDLLRAGRSGSGGSGLGTASVRECVRRLGGRLQVRSRARAGTEFVIRLSRRTDDRIGRRA